MKYLIVKYKLLAQNRWYSVKRDRKRERWVHSFRYYQSIRWLCCQTTTNDFIQCEYVHTHEKKLKGEMKKRRLRRIVNKKLKVIVRHKFNFMEISRQQIFVWTSVFCLHKCYSMGNRHTLDFYVFFYKRILLVSLNSTMLIIYNWYHVKGFILPLAITGWKTYFLLHNRKFATSKLYYFPFKRLRIYF